MVQSALGSESRDSAICTLRFIAALFTIAKRWKPSKKGGPIGGETEGLSAAGSRSACEGNLPVTESKGGVLGAVFICSLCCCIRRGLERDRGMSEESDLQAH